MVRDRYPPSSLREGLVEALGERTPPGELTPDRVKAHRDLVEAFTRERADLVEAAYLREERVAGSVGRAVLSLESIVDELTPHVARAAGLPENAKPLYPR